MSLMNKAERKLGKFAIRGLMAYIVTINLAIYLLSLLKPSINIMGYLIFDPQLIIRGEIWRLLSFVLIPPNMSIIWVIFALYFYYIVGVALEHEWGSFRFNIYYLLGILSTIIGGFISGSVESSLYLNLSLFLAFAHLFPDYVVQLFLLLPVKVKYLGWLNWAFIALAVFSGPMPIKIAAIASLANYFIFFGKDIITHSKTKGITYQNRRKLSYELPQNYILHKCVICGMTEKDDSKMDFRYCKDCAGDHEYCMNHLRTHEHIKI